MKVKKFSESVKSLVWHGGKCNEYKLGYVVKVLEKVDIYGLDYEIGVGKNTCTL